MELYRVKLSFRDRIRERDDARAGRIAPMRYKEAEYHAAVWPDFGGDPVRRACDLAVNTVVGPPDCWGECQPMIVSVEHLGSVAVEPLVRAARTQEESDVD